MNQPSIALMIDAPRSVAASFAAELSGNGIPKWWLAQYGWAADFEAASLADNDGDG